MDDRWLSRWMERRERGREGRGEEGKRGQISLLNVYATPLLGNKNPLYLTLHRVYSLLSEICYTCPCKLVFTYYPICFHLLGTVWGPIPTIRDGPRGRCLFCQKSSYRMMELSHGQLWPSGNLWGSSQVKRSSRNAVSLTFVICSLLWSSQRSPNAAPHLPFVRSKPRSPGTTWRISSAFSTRLLPAAKLRPAKA